MNYLELQAEIAETKAELERIDNEEREAYRAGDTNRRSWERLDPLKKRLDVLERDLKAENAEQGTPATYCIGSDRYAGQVARVQRFKSGDREGQVRVITFQFTGNGGLSGRLYDFRRDNRGYWRGVGGSGGLIIGIAEDYRDPHF